MKKILASTLAMLMAASMMTACGSSDDSSTAADTTSSAAETSATTTTPAAAESVAESTADSSADSEAAEPVDISEAKSSLKNYDSASMTFTADTDPSKFVEPMAEHTDTKEAYVDYDESQIKISMEEVAGVNMIKVEVLDLYDPEFPEDGYKVPKVRLNMANIFKGHEDLLPTVNNVKIDMIYRAVGEFTAEDGTTSMVPGNFMGAICAQTIKDVANPEDLKWTELDNNISASEWTSEWGYCEVAGNDIKIWGAFKDSTDPQYVTFMRWSIANEACFYIADITFFDDAGNVITVDNTFEG